MTTTQIADLIEDQINMVPLDIYLSWLQGSADSGSGDDFVMDFFEEKIADEQMGAIIEAISKHGMTAPIELLRRRGDGLYLQGNGHHRLMAAMLLMLDTIPIYFHSVDSEWHMNFRSTEDSAGNDFFHGRYGLTEAGEIASGDWSGILVGIREEMFGY